jgi:hypothetical protein
MDEEDKLKKLKKLSPEERIAKLKEFQEKGKEEIAEAQKMIRESEEQIESLREVPIPEIKAVDIEHLFSPEERELFKAQRFVGERRKAEPEEPARKAEEAALEETVAAEAPEITREQIEAQRQYQARVEELSRRPAEEIRERMENIYNTARERGYVSREQAQEVRDMQYATREKFDDTTAGEYLPSKKTARDMVVTERMAHWLQQMYRA